MSDRSGLRFGQVHLADKAVINLNVVSACAVLVIAALMHDDFLDKLTQEGGVSSSKLVWLAG